MRPSGDRLSMGSNNVGGVERWMGLLVSRGMGPCGGSTCGRCAGL